MNQNTNAEKNFNFCKTLVSIFCQLGLKEVCISPGSRNTPLSLALYQNPAIKKDVLIDERSAAFFALGKSKFNDQATALLCTSGTAPCHYFPAIWEAQKSSIPLIVISADRPEELKNCYAPQTIDQKDLFGKAVMKSTEVSPEIASKELYKEIFDIWHIALGKNGSKPGPVHINIPFKEPLIPNQTHSQQDDNYKFPHLNSRPQIKNQLDLGLLNKISSSKKILLVAGAIETSNTAASAFFELSECLNTIIFADPLSGLRYHPNCHERIISFYDLFLNELNEFSPEIIIRLGDNPSSKSYKVWRKNQKNCFEILVDPFGRNFDSLNSVKQIIHSSFRDFSKEIKNHLQKQETTVIWGDLKSIKSKEKQAQIKKESFLKQNCELWELPILDHCLQSIKATSLIYFSSSMPIRELDFFSGKNKKPIRFMANRGCNGIDGIIASFLGASTKNESNCYLFIGDIAFFHDLGSLVNLKKLKGKNLNIIVFNNQGGQIFNYLPNKFPQDFMKNFMETKTELSISKIAQSFGLEVFEISHFSQFQKSFDHKQNCHRLFEIKINPEFSKRKHQEFWQRSHL